MRLVFMAWLPLLLLAGCADIFNQHEFKPVMPQVALNTQAPMSKATTGAIYQEGQDVRLFEDRTAHRKGDILTIRLVERTSASKSADTSFKKGDEVSLVNPSLFGVPLSIKGYGLDASVQGDRNFKGEGESNQSNSLNGQISAIVTEVLPNGNLAIRGEKMLNLNQGEEFVQISGIVRPDDIAPDNTVPSSQVADAQITYAGKGAIADANAVGWLVRFFVSALWPF